MDVNVKEQDFFTVEETAEQFNVNPETIRRLVRRGKLRVRTVPGSIKYLVSEQEIERFKKIMQAVSPANSAKINIINELLNTNTNVEVDARFGLKLSQIITNDNIMKIFKVATIGGIKSKKQKLCCSYYFSGAMRKIMSFIT